MSWTNCVSIADLDATLSEVESHGGWIVVPPFELGQMGKASYITDPAGVLVGLHYYNPPL